MAFMKRIRWVFLFAAAAAVAVRAEPVFSLRQDRLTFLSGGATLREFLRGFHDAGVQVRVDPDLEGHRISGQVVDEPVESALRRIAGDFDYAAIWSRVAGPAGPVDRLVELRLFRRGQPERARRLFDEERMAVSEAAGIRFARGELLIGFRPGVTRQQAEELLARIGGNLVGGIPELGVYRVRVPQAANIPDLTAMLSRDPIVAAVEPNRIHDLAAPDRVASSFRGIDPQASGAGRNDALLAVFDSGVQTLEPLDALISGRWNAFDSRSAADDPMGHGTQMALVASGLVTPSGGQDPAVLVRNILAIKGFNDEGMTTSWAVMQAIRLAAENGARVMSISWGSETPSTFLRHAFQAAANGGMLLVASAGNEPTGRPVYPAAWPGVLAVGATDPDGTPSSYSNHGEFLALSSPALAELPVGYGGPPGSYAGTSIASAFTAGILAQYLGMNPGVSAEDAVRRLHASLTPHEDPSHSSRYGAGILDAAAVRRFLGP